MGKNGQGKTLPLRCFFCGGSLKTNNAHIEIYDEELPPFRDPHTRFNEHGGKVEYGGLAYPGIGEEWVQDGTWKRYQRTVLFAHTECGPDLAYHFSFDRLDENWDKHLREKSWWFLGIPVALAVARKAMNIKAVSKL